jgi:hypothetical protein
MAAFHATTHGDADTCEATANEPGSTAEGERRVTAPS